MFIFAWIFVILATFQEIHHHGASMAIWFIVAFILEIINVIAALELK